MNSQINSYLEKVSRLDTNYYKSIKEEYIVLKKEKLSLDEKEYLTKLLKLRDKLIL
ncbi:MAG: hypothetical protein GYB35_12065 [Algicola sp.]|nr:hypothetical protein [Algicola sp.]